MPALRLNILKSAAAAGPDELIRRIRNVELELNAAPGVIEECAAGIAVRSEEFPRVPYANYLAQAHLPEGTTARDAFVAAEEHFARHNAKCWMWQPDGLRGDPSFDALETFFAALGWRRQVHRFYRLQQLTPLEPRVDLTLIPMRASFAKCRELMDAVMAADPRADAEFRTQMTEAFLRQLDDTRIDGLLALRGIDPVGIARLSSAGDFGYISGMVVHPAALRQRIGATLLLGLCDLAARSRLRDVTLCVWADNAPAIALYERLGFAPLGERIAWRRP